MQLNISGHHVEVTDSLKKYVQDKFLKLTRHVEYINSVNAILSVEKLVHKAEATVRVNGAEIFAAVESENMYAAIDLLADKLDRSLIKHKEKILDRKQQAR